MEVTARWQSGYAADCNSVYAGSIPTLASILPYQCPGGGIGRRCGLKIHFPKGSAGSSPAPGTITLNSFSMHGLSVKSVSPSLSTVIIM